MYRITYFLIFLVLAFPALSVDVQTYIDEELRKESKEYRESLERCIKLFNEADLEAIEREKCNKVFERYREIKNRALNRLDKELKKKAETKHLRVELSGFKLGKYNFLFTKIPLDPKKYSLYSCGRKDEVVLCPHCFVDNYAFFFFQLPEEKKVPIDIYYMHRVSSKNIEEFYLGIDKLYKISISSEEAGEFIPFKADIEKKGDAYVIKLPSPVVEAFVSYDFLGVKKSFPRFNQDRKSCSRTEMLVDSIPDGVYIEFPIEEDKHVSDRAFKVN